MDRINFFEGPRVTLEGEHGWLSASVEGRTILLHQRTRSLVIDTMQVVGHREPADVELKFGLLDGKVIVYWREPFINRVQKHGVLAISAAGLSELCAGSRGLNFSH